MRVYVCVRLREACLGLGGWFGLDGVSLALWRIVFVAGFNPREDSGGESFWRDKIPLRNGFEALGEIIVTTDDP